VLGYNNKKYKVNMKKKREKLWVNKAESFDAAKEYDDDYYLSMSEKERLETVQFLREEYFKIKKGSDDENRKRLRRVIRIIK